jgi:hypothetical protein
MAALDIRRATQDKTWGAGAGGKCMQTLGQEGVGTIIDENRRIIFKCVLHKQVTGCGLDSYG